MRYSVLGTNYVIRLDAGEKVVESLLYLCEREGIGSGFFNGLGAAGEAEFGHFDPSSNDYYGKPFIHAHAALGDKTFAVRGGHLREAVVSVTCEVTLTRFRDDIGRKKDEAKGT